jgi:hypothetical protein
MICFLVPDNSSVGDGTLFLQEYMIPRGSTSFCIYDTRSLSDDSAENTKMLNHWMENGVRHGELAIRFEFSSLHSLSFGVYEFVLLSLMSIYLN